MKKFSVVIGTNYGDEGKGLTTDWLSVQQTNTAVARFSGGANAGHTVELDDGTRHVFSHFGSGSLNNIPTILTRDFIVNPVLFWNELERFPQNIKNIQVYVDPRCKVTTPFDVMLNQELERIRNNFRHGSTGVGINETVVRHEYDTENLGLIVNDLCYPNRTKSKLTLIKSFFIKKMTKINSDFDFSIIDEAVQRFINDARDFMKFITTMYDYYIIEEFDHVIFEGSQGLMLDQKSNDFPHVTRANTGITNILQYLHDDVQLNLYYVTRSYLTRHGAGEMPTENSAMCYYDETNQTNEFQGSLRFGELDFQRMQDVVQKDISQLDGIDYNINTMMTWYKDSDFLKLKQFSESINADNWFCSFGKTRTSILKM